MSRTIRIAHRGASYDHPENTLLAYRAAIDAGVDYIEIDVQVTRNGELIVMHDEELDRTTNGTGFIHNHPFSHIRELDAGRGERVPLLSEVIDLAHANNIRLCIEVKGVDEPASVAITELVITAIQRANFVPYTVLTSFFPAALRTSKQLDPRIPTLLDPSPQDGTLTPWEICEQTLSAHANIISFDFEHVTAAVAREAELTGLALWPWAPNTPADIKKMLSLNVPAIMTDNPVALNETLRMAESR